MAKLNVPQDFKEFLKLLNAKGVRYLVVGGYAVAYHGYVRPTADLDIWAEPDRSNAEKLVMVVGEFGFALPEVTPDLFLNKKKIMRMGAEPVRIEIMSEIDGVAFADCYGRRVEGRLDDTDVSVIGLADLLANKKASGRFKDLADVEELQ